MKSQIKKLIDDSNSILLLTHESPDGDAIGSVLAFYHYLTAINKNVDMVVIDVPKVFEFLPSIDKIVDNVSKKYDLGIVVDCAAKERIGQKNNLFNMCKKTICIDHHFSNTNYCDINYVAGDISSCCQVIYYLFKDYDINISTGIGEALITGMLTDTNGFRNNNVSSETYSMASELLNAGVNISDIYDRVLCKKTMSRYNLMKIAMDRLEFLSDGKIAFTYIMKDDFNNVGAIIGEHEGIVDIGRSIDGVMVSIFIREDDGYTVSLRSTGTVDVSKIALSLDGGGHMMAAGCKLYGSFEEVKETIINKTKKELFK